MTIDVRSVGIPTEIQTKRKGIFKIAHIINVVDGKKSDRITSDRVCDCGNSTDFIYDETTGDVICGKCGLILEEKTIDHGKEWREYTYEDSKNRSRTGDRYNIYFYDGGLSTVIDSSYRDINGQPLSPFARHLQRRLKETHKRYKGDGSEDRNFVEAMTQLNALARVFSLNKKTKEEIIYKYRRILKSQRLKRRTIHHILLALIYIVRAEEKHPIPLAEICKKGNIPETIFTEYRKKVYNALDMKPITITPLHFLNTLHSALHPNDPFLLKLSERIYHRVVKMNPNMIYGKDPMGVAGGIYYLASMIMNKDSTQQQIRDILYITDATIRQRYYEICNILFESEYPVIDHLKAIVSSSKIDGEKMREFIDELIYRY